MGFNCIKAKATVPWFWPYGLIRLLGPSGPYVVSRPETPWSIFFFFEISWFHWIHLMIHEKIKSCLWKLELEFWTNGLISPLPKDLEPNCPSFRPQTPNVIALGSQSFVMSISITFGIKQALIFNIWVIFNKVMNVYPQKTAKSLLFGTIWDM